MSSQKQLLIMIVVMASFTSFLAGYILTQPGQKAADVLSQQRSAILDRFNQTSMVNSAPDTLFQVNGDAVLSVANDSDSNSVLYFKRSTGALARVGIESRKITPVYGDSIPNLKKVIWSG